MIILIGGSSHTGKTNLSQKLLEKYKYPYISIDHIKMGLIRSGMTDVSVEDDDGLTELLWPIVREMIKTMIENDQNAIIEGCYIPYDWKDSFDEEYLEDIEGLYLVMTPEYINNHFEQIREYGSVIENRGDDEYCVKDELLRDNVQCLEMCEEYGCKYVLIDGEYDIEKIMSNIVI